MSLLALIHMFHKVMKSIIVLIFFTVLVIFILILKTTLIRNRSFSLILYFEKDKQIHFEPVYHHKQDGIVQISPKEKQIDLKSLNSKLGKEYKKYHDEMTLEIFNKKVKRNLIYSLTPIPYDGKFISSLKKMARLL